MAYGSGTLFQRGKKGIWYYQAYVDGCQFGPISSGSIRREDAQRELDKFLGQRARGAVSAKSDSIIINELHHYMRPENPRRLIRNQRSPVRIPAGGSMILKSLVPFLYACPYLLAAEIDNNPARRSYLETGELEP